MLLTADRAAQVIDPNTKFAWAKYLSEKPDNMFELRLGRTVWRLLRASYCEDNSPLIDELAAGGRYTLNNVEQDPTNNGWLHVSCTFVNPQADAAFTAHGTADIWLDAAQDFVIRKTKTVSLEPYMAEAVKEVGPYVPLGNGAWVPKACSLTVYSLRGAQAEPAGEPRAWTERLDFELLGDVETAAIPESYFTLESLGVDPPRTRRNLWLSLGVFASLFGIAILALLRRRSAAIPHEDGFPPAEVSR